MKNIGVNKAKTCLVKERISALQVETGWVINITWSNEVGYCGIGSFGGLACVSC